jgi:hypothetical protein
MNDLQLLEASSTPLFARPVDQSEAIRLRRELGEERARRAGAEETVADLARLVAQSQAALASEREARARAESASSHLARLVAEEHARARSAAR